MVSIRWCPRATRREGSRRRAWRFDRGEGGIAAEHGDVLIREQRRPDGPSRTVGPRERPRQPAAAVARAREAEHLGGEAREEARLAPPADAARHRSKAGPGEEAQMRRIEDAAAV